jgi:choline dehydrogenase-like flavoprotein
MWGIGTFSEPLMQLEAVPKPRNRTESVDRYMQVPFYSNPFSILKDSFKYLDNQLGIVVDDSKITVTDEMCEAITSAMKPMREGGRLQNEADAGVPTRIRRTVLSILTNTGISRLVKPNAATFWNAEGFTGKGINKGKRCRTSMLTSYYHYYGGNAKVVDDSYQVNDTPGLFVSDASVLKRLTPGPPSPTIMQTGMRVADALVESLDNDS